MLPIHLASRFGVLAVGFLAVLLIGFPPEATNRWRIYSNDLLDLPARWDTGWYLGIATEGYRFDPNARADYQQNIAFFPAFPMSMRYLSVVLGRQPLWTGVGISLVSFFLALDYFLRLARSLLQGRRPGSHRRHAAGGVSVRGVLQRRVHRRPVPPDADGRGLPLSPEPAAARGVLGRAVRPDAAERRAAVDRARDHGGGADVGCGASGGRSCRRRRAGARSCCACSRPAAPGYGMLAFSAFIYQLTGNPFTWTMQNVAWGGSYRSLDSIVSDRVGFIANNGLYSYASTQTIDLFYSLAVLLALAAVWPVYRRFGLALRDLHPDHHPAADGGGRDAVDGTSDVDPVSGVPVDGRGRPGPPSHGVDRAVRLAAGICGGDVFYVEAVVLSRSSYQLDGTST